MAFRARMAIQYGGNIDEVVAQLGTRNNGLYTNEWLIGDAKTNEIAMYELGTNHTRLWRSSKNEWFGDTPGFYWGDNNAKDLTSAWNTMPDPQGTPEYVPYVPMPRDLAWQELLPEVQRPDRRAVRLPGVPHRAAGERRAPWTPRSSTADMANRMMVWAEIGKPNQREWLPGGRSGYSGNDGLYPSGYYLFQREPPRLRPRSAKREAPRRPSPSGHSSREDARILKDRLWKGWVLPASEADTWFVAGAAAYHRVLQSDDLEGP